MSLSQTIEYLASPTLSEFHADNDNMVRGIVGPIGSGKSVGCVWDLWQHAQAQLPGPDGIRRTRWAVIRNTYRELNDTTLRTFFDWFPRSMGVWRAADMTFVVAMGDIHCEFLFRGLDRPDDASKLLSLELTGAWINEAREVPKAILSMLQGRVGRYPSKRHGGPSWYGIIMDTNPCDEDHWWYKVFEEDRPQGWKIYHQPDGLGPDAENIENLVPGYYTNLMSGQDQEWINVYVHGKYGFVKDGKPVHPLYKDALHTAPDLLTWQGGLLSIGCDFGLTPAALIWEQTATGQWRALSEVVTEDTPAELFGPILKEHIAKTYSPHARYDMFGDPAGDQRSATREAETVFTILQGQGLAIYPCETNDVVIRRASIDTLLTKLTVAGEPAMLVSPACRMFRKGLNGGFKYRRIKVGGDEKYADSPDKGTYSHIVEAGEYGLVGAGIGYDVLDGNGRPGEKHIPQMPKVTTQVPQLW